ncbi:MAG: hypothetical protein H6736_15525 [Alphaproteobacteria bacterium]|nr:hypothetical protein [Alphaproteobacteria bacterium]MCB9693220.1 hypothetical protein [Alphaproteobacteria bacterium]
MLASLLLRCAFAGPEVPSGTTEPTGVPEASDLPAEAEPASVNAPAANAPGLDFVYTPTKPGQITVDSPYWDLEVLYYLEKNVEGQRLAEQRYAETHDPHLTLHIARFAYQRLEGDETTPKSEREAIYDEAIRILDEGLAADPDDMHLKFAKGVVMARLGTTRGVLASLRMATTIEGAWMETATSDFRYHSIGTHEVLPCDAYLALGVFYRLVPDWWIVKAIAGTRGDLEKSLEMQQKSVACSGDAIRNLKELAVSQLCLGQRKKDEALVSAGKATINRFLGLTPTMEAEVVDIKHGVMLLKDPTLACEYSRDGQQDLDQAKLEK